MRLGWVVLFVFVQCVRTIVCRMCVSVSAYAVLYMQSKRTHNKRNNNQLYDMGLCVVLLVQSSGVQSAVFAICISRRGRRRRRR